ncbi:unannotated protein [freshwater metagenome]|uniref:Unannotated protein n=1 Tax=freshwater metagenome TaxID=449393 RepID=A0A6J6J791_9ZZZZ
MWSPRLGGSANVAAIRPLPEPSAMLGKIAKPAPRNCPTAHAEFASALPKLGLNFTVTPAGPPATAENQKGETSLRMSAFATALVIPAGLVWLVIQYGIHPVMILGPPSACAAGMVKEAPAIAKAMRATRSFIPRMRTGISQHFRRTPIVRHESMRPESSDRHRRVA